MIRLSRMKVSVDGGYKGPTYINNLQWGLPNSMDGSAFPN